MEDADSERVARGLIGAAKEVGFEVAVRELGAAGIDGARISSGARGDRSVLCGRVKACTATERGLDFSAE